MNPPVCIFSSKTKKRKENNENEEEPKEQSVCVCVCVVSVCCMWESERNCEEGEQTNRMNKAPKMPNTTAVYDFVLCACQQKNQKKRKEEGCCLPIKPKAISS